MASVGIGPGVCILDSKVIHDTPTNVAGDFSRVDDQNIWKFAYGARNEASYHLHHESLLSYLRFVARVEILMHRGRVAWHLRRRITGRLLAAIRFNPKAEQVSPARAHPLTDDPPRRAVVAPTFLPEIGNHLHSGGIHATRRE